MPVQLYVCAAVCLAAMILPLVLPTWEAAATLGVALGGGGAIWFWLGPSGDPAFTAAVSTGFASTVASHAFSSMAMKMSFERASLLSRDIAQRIEVPAQARTTRQFSGSWRRIDAVLCPVGDVEDARSIIYLRWMTLTVISSVSLVCAIVAFGYPAAAISGLVAFAFWVASVLPTFRLRFAGVLALDSDGGIVCQTVDPDRPRLMMLPKADEAMWICDYACDMKLTAFRTPNPFVTLVVVGKRARIGAESLPTVSLQHMRRWALTGWPPDLGVPRG